MDLVLLKQAAIFHDLDEGELARVLEICKEQKFQSATTVFKEGEPSNRLYIIAEGDVRISRIVPGSGEERWRSSNRVPASAKWGFRPLRALDRRDRQHGLHPAHDHPLRLRAALDFNRDIAYKVLWAVVRCCPAACA